MSRWWRREPRASNGQDSPHVLREGAPDGPHPPEQSGPRPGQCPVARGRVECTRTTDAARALRAECVTAFCAFFHSHEEEYRVLLPFIHEGFARGEKAFHIVDPARRDAHLQRLAAAGIDTVAAQQRGQLEVCTWTRPICVMATSIRTGCVPDRGGRHRRSTARVPTHAVCHPYGMGLGSVSRCGCTPGVRGQGELWTAARP